MIWSFDTPLVNIIEFLRERWQRQTRFFFSVFKINCLSCLQRNTNKLFFSFCWRILFLQDRNSSNEYRYLISLRITWYNAHFFGFCLSDFCGSSSGANINFLHGWNLDFHDFSLFLVHKCLNFSHQNLHPPKKNYSNLLLKNIAHCFWYKLLNIFA